MKAWSPVQRLGLLTCVTAVVMGSLLVALNSVESNSAPRKVLAIAGFVAFLATLGFAWALANSVLAARQSRNQL